MVILNSFLFFVDGILSCCAPLILLSLFPFSPGRRLRSVYVEAKEEGHWDNNQHRAVVTTKINENRNKSYSLSDHGLSVNGVIAHDSPRPCQFIVGIEGSEMPAPWA